ncbi:CRISPR-associated Cse2 family protein [Tamilnaduibacter salinus]|uniref:CRISPR-associated Cse2 family protein n=1 Tax=Tamilnaduibacter salinus TaxID=1484056 RepID=A0A2U1D1G5_9GAMM|nr:type I-E CRISPR-associated protein Cse2/CasB [Tamilnaduibacter salinus]PVY79148.1 CRISPR-associated Cse2 family protein [Tamilnaduibacter salinus]
MSDEPFYFRIKEPSVREAVLEWWQQLDKQRGTRAELRRSDTLDAVLLTEGFRNLWQALEQTGQRRDRDMLSWACVAAALAEVREQPTAKDTTFARRLGEQKEKTGKPYMSEMRFAQLQKSRSGDDFLMRLRRALSLINKTAPVLSLADNILHWFQEQQGDQAARPMDRLAVRWATDYFTAVNAYDK